MLPAAYTCPDILHSSRRTPIPGNSLFPQRSTFAFNGLRFFRGLFLRSNASSHARASTLVLGITTLVSDDLRSLHDLPCARRLLLRSGTYIYLCGAFSSPTAYSCVPATSSYCPGNRFCCPKRLPLSFTDNPFSLLKLFFSPQSARR